ncbi:hypothetical protein [Roseateles sp.]|uniref:hypothetical protein n=1 Tax=Roseateles sp. TaxID=1971397 RepID=UPI002F427A21
MSPHRAAPSRARTWAPRSAAFIVSIALSGCAVSPASAPTSTPMPTPVSDGIALPAPVYVAEAGFPRPSAVRFETVSWIERDPRTGFLHVLQRADPVVSVWTPDGRLVSTWPATGTLGDPHSLSIHTAPDGSTQVWITDMAPPQPAGPAFGHCLKRFTPEGRLVATLGTCGQNSQGTGLDPVQFDKVTDVAWNAAGQLLVTDGDVGGLNNRVLRLDAAGRVLAHWSAPGDRPGNGPGQFNLPHAAVVDRCDRLWVADALNHRVQVIDATGRPVGSLDGFGALGVYALAFGPALDSPARQVLFVGASPSAGGGVGSVSLFAVPMDCARSDFSDLPGLSDLKPFTRFDVPLPASSSTTLLHAMAVDPVTWDVYLAVLGTGVPPSKWTATWPAGRPRP